MAKEGYKWGKQGARLRDARLALGFKTQKDFAAYAGIHKQTYGNWERGEKSPNPDDAALLHNCGISIVYYLTGQGPMIHQPVITKFRRTG